MPKGTTANSAFSAKLSNMKLRKRSKFSKWGDLWCHCTRSVLFLLKQSETFSKPLHTFLFPPHLCPSLPPVCPSLSPPSPSAHICCKSEQWSTGSPEYYLKIFHSSSRLLVSPSICCPEPKGNMGFTKRARDAENAITAYPSCVPSFSLLIQGNGEDVFTPQTSALLLSFIFLTRFYLPLQSLLFLSASPLGLFCLIGPSVATTASLFLRLYFAPLCSEAILTLLFGACFIPLFSLPDFISHTSDAHVDIHEIRAIWSSCSGLMEEGRKGKRMEVES